MTKTEKKKWAGTLKKHFRWLGVDLYGVCLYQKKPKLVKTKYSKKKGSDYFKHFDTEDDFVELEEYDHKKVDNELKRNPKLHRVKLEMTFQDD